MTKKTFTRAGSAVFWSVVIGFVAWAEYRSWPSLAVYGWAVVLYLGLIVAGAAAYHFAKPHLRAEEAPA